jgi:hypothetical protein
MVKVMPHLYHLLQLPPLGWYVVCHHSYQMFTLMLELKNGYLIICRFFQHFAESAENNFMRSKFSELVLNVNDIPFNFQQVFLGTNFFI